MVFAHKADYPSQWAAIGAIAPKIGGSPETLRSWVRQAEHELDAVAATFNSRPRKTLDWQTPAEALKELLSLAS